MIRILKLDCHAKAVMPHPGEQFFLSRTAQLLVFRSGESEFGDLVRPSHCIVLIPRVIHGSPEVTVVDTEGSHATKQIATIRFEVDSIYMIPGRCLISLPESSKIVCAMLCIKRGSK